MSARDDILKRVRRNRPPSGPLPEPDDLPAIRYDDPHAQFEEVLTGVGGRFIHVSSRAEADRQLRQLEEYGGKTVSLVEGVGETNFDLAAVDDPHTLDDVEFAVLPGRLAVAENAAVWVNDEGIAHRVLYFLPQFLGLVVPNRSVVSNMHEAYRQVDVTGRPFGAFISGPSKTADIEQSLVLGAHGARTLTVFLIDEIT